MRLVRCSSSPFRSVSLIISHAGRPFCLPVDDFVGFPRYPRFLTVLTRVASACASRFGREASPHTILRTARAVEQCFSSGGVSWSLRRRGDKRRYNVQVRNLRRPVGRFGGCGLMIGCFEEWNSCRLSLVGRRSLVPVLRTRKQTERSMIGLGQH